jgi:catechol 2,3-dioxygenase-like lactoylglutathione lyase family enzyme
MKRLYNYAPGLFFAAALSLLITGAVKAQSTVNNTPLTAKTNQIMEQRLSFITIGAKDMNKLKQFYIEKFNWTPLKDNGGIVFFKMNGFILGLFPSDELAADATVAKGSNGSKGFTLSVNFRSEKEVDEVFKTLQNRGVQIIKPPKKASWGGYSCYVADIEGNLWEIAYNPFLVMDAAGNVLTHH